MKPLVVIPARGGSKRLPRKNIKLLSGKPLIHYTIETAREIFDDSVICVSTDDEEIKKVSEQTDLEVPFLRPKELASDTADSRSVLLHAYEYYKVNINYEADVIILLQPTSPLRNGKHIKEALDLYYNGLDMVASVKETHANPYFVLYEEDQNGYIIKSKESDCIRSQDCPKVWELNGSIFVINVKSLLKSQPKDFNKVIKYEMDVYHSIDIDNWLDFKLVEILLNDENNNIA